MYKCALPESRRKFGDLEIVPCEEKTGHREVETEQNKARRHCTRYGVNREHIRNATGGHSHDGMHKTRIEFRPAFEQTTSHIRSAQSTREALGTETADMINIGRVT